MRPVVLSCTRAPVRMYALGGRLEEDDMAEAEGESGGKIKVEK